MKKFLTLLAVIVCLSGCGKSSDNYVGQSSVKTAQEASFSRFRKDLQTALVSAIAYTDDVSRVRSDWEGKMRLPAITKLFSFSSGTGDGTASYHGRSRAENNSYGLDILSFTVRMYGEGGKIQRSVECVAFIELTDKGYVVSDVEIRNE